MHGHGPMGTHPLEIVLSNLRPDHHDTVYAKIICKYCELSMTPEISPCSFVTRLLKFEQSTSVLTDHQIIPSIMDSELSIEHDSSSKPAQQRHSGAALMTRDASHLCC